MPTLHGGQHQQDGQVDSHGALEVLLLHVERGVPDDVDEDGGEEGGDQRGLDTPLHHKLHQQTSAAGEVGFTDRLESRKWNVGGGCWT